MSPRNEFLTPFYRGQHVLPMVACKAGVFWRASAFWSSEHHLGFNFRRGLQRRDEKASKGVGQWANLLDHEIPIVSLVTSFLFFCFFFVSFVCVKCYCKTMIHFSDCFPGVRHQVLITVPCSIVSLYSCIIDDADKYCSVILDLVIRGSITSEVHCTLEELQHGCGIG